MKSGLSLTEFSHYAIAVKKRLVNHFGMRSVDAVATMDGCMDRVFRWYKKGLPADTAARVIFDQRYVANPVSGDTWYWLAAIGAGMVGVYLLTKAKDVGNAPPDTVVQPPAYTEPVSIAI